MPYYGPMVRLQTDRWRARHGKALEGGPVAIHPDQELAALMLAADLALAGNDGRGASAAADEARRIARDAGLRLREAETHAQTLDAALLVDDRTTARESAEALATFGGAFPSRRFVAEALLGRLLVHETPDWAGLEHLAAETSAATVSRRARALLGDTAVPLDTVDRLVLATVQRRPGWASPEGPQSTWSPAWGLDERHTRIWLPDGAWVEFRSRPMLWKLLLVLTDLGGEHGVEVAKEAVCEAVWAPESYHPLQHDNRLHAAIRQLRVALGEPEPPLRVFTTPTGYRLGTPFRRARAPVATE